MELTRDALIEEIRGMSDLDLESLEIALQESKGLTMPALLTTKDVQAILQVSRPTVYKLIKSGDLKRIQYTLGGKKLFRKSEVQKFLNNKLV
tara:strand:+ start:93 stop:368 length:276 start_codon:yes stop_codon:yes gene_type:complete